MPPGATLPQRTRSGDEQAMDNAGLHGTALGASYALTDALAVRASGSVPSRFEDAGLLPREVAQQLGLVGLAAHASGLDREVGKDQPSGVYRFKQVPVAVLDSGDVYARARLRHLEIERSAAFIADLPGSLLRKTFAIDVLRCPWCGARRAVLAAVTRHHDIEKALAAKGLGGAGGAQAPPRVDGQAPQFFVARSGESAQRARSRLGAARRT